jgi:hypothetical protein
MDKYTIIKNGFIFFILILPSIAAVQQNPQILQIHQENNESINYSINFSQPRITQIEGSKTITINIEETTTHTYSTDGSLLPCFNKIFTFPLGTKITHIDCHYSPPMRIPLDKKIQKNQLMEFYPNNPIRLNKLQTEQWYQWKIGGGINDGNHVLYLIITCYPVKYQADNDLILFVDQFEFTIHYQPQQSLTLENNEYDFLIISPSSFSENLERLIQHKTSHGIKTKLITIQDIYQDTYFSVEGRDDAEEIKLFLFDAFIQWGIEYVLLVGDINKIPIRETRMGTGANERSPLTDLYYADLCFGDGSFCSWDSNNNGIYGEIWHGSIDDQVDLYPDIHIGRFPCTTNADVKVVVDKIIHYEENSFGSEWSDTIVLAGGDTHSTHNSYPEGELLINEIKKVTPTFNHILLKTSDETFTAESLNNAINQGAGFMCYAGHGFEIGLSTHPPNSEEWIDYTLLDLIAMKNNGKYPIVVFNACLTARLDYNIANLIADIVYFSSPLPKLEKRDDITFPILFPCIAWKMISKPNSGAVATIGATRIAYSMIDQNGNVKWGCGVLTLNFFKSISTGQYLSNCFVSAQNLFLNTLNLKDPFTIEEFVLLGDPTLRIGGYE